MLLRPAPFSIRKTESVEVDRQRGYAIVRYRRQAVSVADYMEALFAGAGGRAGTCQQMYR